MSVPIGEVEEFLWTLSTCLEGEIGDWRLRFGGATVSVRVDFNADRVVISAPIAFEGAPRGHAFPSGVCYLNDGSELHATLVA